MNLTTRTTIGGIEVRPGVEIPRMSASQGLAFRVVSICEAENPQRWRGEVRFNGHTLMRTGSVDNYDRAGRLAEEALNARIVDLFSA